MYPQHWRHMCRLCDIFAIQANAEHMPLKTGFCDIIVNIKKADTARLRESDRHPIRSKTPAPQNQHI